MQYSLRTWVLGSALIWSWISISSVSATTPLFSADSASQPVETDEVLVAQAHTKLLKALSENVTPYYVSELAPLYAKNDLQPMWRDPLAIQRFQQQLAELALSGIHPRFIQWIKWLTDQSISGMARDIVLSDAMFGYLHFVANVAAQGETWLYDDSPYKMGIPPTVFLNRWKQTVQQGNIAEYMASLAPQHPQYKNMRQVLKKLLSEQHQPWPQLPNGSNLIPGKRDVNLPILHKILSRANTWLTATTPVTDLPPSVDTLYNPALVTAVKRFQQAQGLTPDGIIGTGTRKWLNLSPQKRATLLALNMQRLRILPADMKTGIMVNIADYSLHYYQEGNEILSSAVIVGRPSRKTPFMSSALSNVVINPPWNVPTSMVKNDILPKVKYDATYLKQHGYTILTNWNNNAKIIDQSTINWHLISANNFPYRLRQAPGINNALGRYKFNMPSSDSIYLHDTPNHRLFQKETLALSSGCVRVHKAAILAKMLLKDAGWDETRLSNTLKQGNTTYVNIRQHLPVLLYYLTSWVDKEGKVQFRTDIYNYDTAAQSGTQIVTQATSLIQ
nr:L,D-transpeptidase [Candidatus Regiella insecticola]